MALVVLLRGVNVGGHRTFRPTMLAAQLEHLEVVNIGAAGTFVVRRRIAQSQLRAEVARRLPFHAEVIICKGHELARLLDRDFFAGQPRRRDIVRFVSVLARSPRAEPTVPMSCPATGQWQLKVLAREGRYVIGVYRRRMKAIGWLGTLDRVFGVPVTTRNWNTIESIAKVLNDEQN